MIYQFGACVFDRNRGEVQRTGEVIRLDPQVLAVLTYLLTHRDRVVSRDELLEHCWPDRYVSDGALSRCLSRLRHDLGHDRQTSPIIETVHRRGYQFVAEVQEVEETVAPAEQVQHTPPSEPIISPDTLSPSPPPAMPEADAEPERRHLTVLRCMICDAEDLSFQLDPEDHYELMQAFRSTCMEIVSQYEGHVVQQLDDGMLAYFGYPQAHEDDAQRAVYSGLALVETLGRLVLPGLTGEQAGLRVRVGIDTGMVIVSSRTDGRTPPSLAVGPATAQVPQLAALAEPGAVVISEATTRLIHGYFDCKALAPSPSNTPGESVVGYEVLGMSGLQTRLEVGAARGLTPFVGREVEVALLRERWTYVQEGIGQAVLIQGEAGIGKSRLVQAVKEQLDEAPASTQEWRCSPYHQYTAFYPLIDLLQRAMQHQATHAQTNALAALEGLLESYPFPLSETVPLLAALLSLPVPEARYAPLYLTPQRQRQRTIDLLVELLVAQATKGPSVFIVEDVHWADPSTLDFLDLVLKQTPSLPLLVMLTCRQTFVAPWEAQRPLTPLVIERLTRPQTHRMIVQASGGKGFTNDVMSQLTEKVDGVPLYVEELTRMILESGQFEETAEVYALMRESAELSVPATLHDSLMARLDQLGSGKEVAQWASVLGREFSHDMMTMVAPFEEATLDAGLKRLVQMDLLYPRGVQPSTMQYRFKHALIQEVAYESIPKRRRLAIHAQVAQVLAAEFGDLVERQPELLARHYTAAGLAEQAVSFWLRAGQLAMQRSAYREAVGHLKAGQELLVTLTDSLAHAHQELMVQLNLGGAFMAVHGLFSSEVEQAYSRAYDLCEHVGEPKLLAAALYGLWRYDMTRGFLVTARQLGERLLDISQRQAIPELSLRAHMMLGSTLYFLGEFDLAHQHLEQYIAGFHTPSYQPDELVHPDVAGLAIDAQALWMLGYPDRALERAQVALALAETVPYGFSLGFASIALARLHTLRGEARLAQEHSERALAISQEQELPFFEAQAMILHSWILIVQDQMAEGFPQLHEGLARYDAIGATILWTVRLVILAEAYQRHGQPEEGLGVLADRFGQTENRGDMSHEAELYRLQGELLLQKSKAHAPAAETAFQQALDLAREQRAKAWELRAATSLARLWQSQGKHREARDVLAPVYDGFTEGFDVVDLREAQQVLDELSTERI